MEQITDLGVDFDSLQHLGGSTANHPVFSLGLIGIYTLSIKNIVIPNYYYNITGVFYFNYYTSGGLVLETTINVDFTRGMDTADFLASLNAQISPLTIFTIGGTINYMLDDVPYSATGSCINGDIATMIIGLNIAIGSGGVLFSLDGSSLVISAGISGATNISITAPSSDTQDSFYRFLGIEGVELTDPTTTYGENQTLPYEAPNAITTTVQLEFRLISDNPPASYLQLWGPFGYALFPNPPEEDAAVYLFLGFTSVDGNYPRPSPSTPVYLPYTFSAALELNGPNWIYMLSLTMPQLIFVLNTYGSTLTVMYQPCLAKIPIPPGETYIDFTPTEPIFIALPAFSNTIATFDLFFSTQKEIRSDQPGEPPVLTVCQPGDSFSTFLEFGISLQ